MVQAVHDASIARDALDIVEIARAHYELVFRFCARRVGPDHASDVAQDTFLTAQRALRRFRGESTLQTWLLGIANNECRRVAKKRRVEPPTLELRDDFGVDPEAAWIQRHSLEQALASLSPEHREAVLLIELDGMTYDEAAIVIGVPAGTVKSRLHYAFQHLRKALTDGGQR